MFHSANTLNTALASWGVRRQMRFLFLWRLENFTLYVNFKNFMLFLEDFSFFLLILVYASVHACSCSFISDTMRGHESTLCVALCPGSVLFCFAPYFAVLANVRQFSSNSGTFTCFIAVDFSIFDLPLWALCVSTSSSSACI